MKRFKHRVEYALVAALDFLFYLFPAPIAFKIGERLGTLLSKIIVKRNALILSNLERAFPEKSPDERRRIAAAVWRNLGRIAVEFIRMPEILANPEKFPVHWDGAEHLERALAEGKGVILLSAHFTNWEITGSSIRERFGHFTAIARPMRNPFVENWVQSKRAAQGMKIILHREAVRASLKWVRGKNIIGILVDQNLYTGGEFVNFFGRPAATTTLPALLHARTGAPVLITYTLREGAGFRIAVTEPVAAPKVNQEAELLRAHTQEISNRFERIIRDNPCNWFWIHNRWKRKI